MSFFELVLPLLGLFNATRLRALPKILYTYPITCWIFEAEFRKFVGLLGRGS